MARPGCPAEFRRRTLLDLIQAGRSIADVRTTSIREQTIDTWRRQDRIDRGLVPGQASAEQAELTAAKKRNADLAAELTVSRRAVELSKEESPVDRGPRQHDASWWDRCEAKDVWSMTRHIPSDDARHPL